MTRTHRLYQLTFAFEVLEFVLLETVSERLADWLGGGRVDLSVEFVVALHAVCATAEIIDGLLGTQTIDVTVRLVRV